jgi:methylmalonyl-CoA mutase N-terminal domain/subunit
MEQGCFDYFEKIDQFGGMVEAIEAGFPQKEIWDASYQFQRAVEAGEKLIVGLNAYQMDQEEPYDILYIDDSLAAEQVELLNEVRSKRNVRAVAESLQRLKTAAADPKVNTMPYILECVKTYASVGEISDALREVFGTYQEPALF